MMPDQGPQLADYVAHVVRGVPIREIARVSGCHPSTVLRRVRKLETRRDDPLLDAALDRLEGSAATTGQELAARGLAMTQKQTPMAQGAGPEQEELSRVLRRLCEAGAVLAMSQDMDKGVVVRDGPDGVPIRTAVVDRDLAMSLALKDWVSLKKQGRVNRYEVTAVGRAACKRMLAAEANEPQGFAEQHRVWGTRDEMTPEGKARPLRVNMAESPLALLARRRDKDGKPFLAHDLVAAGERLREDFELAQMGPSVTQNWDRFLTGPGTGGSLSDGKGGGSDRARARFQTALGELGPGLGDVALRCCCYLEGLETVEKRLGWAARSGKIVLRIALQRLKRHYDVLHGPGGPMIG